MRTGFIIYGLQDPNSLEIRYIGKSSSGLVRPRDHLKPSHVRTDKNSRKRRWLESLYAENIRPRIVILEHSVAENIDADERKWIAYAKQSGWKITNVFEGGEGGKLPLETRKKISVAMMGHAVPQSTRDAVADSNRKRKPYVRTAAIRDASHDRQVGKVFSEEHLKNLREGVRRREARRRARLGIDTT